MEYKSEKVNNRVCLKGLCAIAIFTLTKKMIL